MKRWIALLLAAMLLFALAACGESNADSTQPTEAPDKTFTAEGVSITLPAGFSAMQIPDNNTSLIAGYSGDDGFIGIYMIRESLDALGKDDAYTAEDYLNDLRSAAGVAEATEVEHKNGLPCFTYTEDKPGAGSDLESDEPVVVKYLNVGYRSGGNCYVVQFFCYEQEYDYFADKFLTWAGTVTFAD